MKKLLCIALLLFSISVNAQFTLTKEGFVNSKDVSKKYTVFDIENQPKEHLYVNVLKFVTQQYKSAKDVISKVENEVITINAKEPEQIYCKNQRYDIQYTISISFKDNKIKIDAPVFECSAFAYNKPYRLTMSGSNGGFGSEVTIGLFKKDGTPGQKVTILEIENFLNGLCNSIVKSASGSDNDW